MWAVFRVVLFDAVGRDLSEAAIKAWSAHSYRAESNMLKAQSKCSAPKVFVILHNTALIIHHCVPNVSVKFILNSGLSQ